MLHLKQSLKYETSVRSRALRNAVEIACGGLTLHNRFSLNKLTEKLLYVVFLDTEPCFRQPGEFSLHEYKLFLDSHKLKYSFSSPTP